MAAADRGGLQQDGAGEEPAHPVIGPLQRLVHGLSDTLDGAVVVAKYRSAGRDELLQQPQVALDTGVLVAAVDEDHGGDDRQVAKELPQVPVIEEAVLVDAGLLDRLQAAVEEAGIDVDAVVLRRVRAS